MKFTSIFLIPLFFLASCTIDWDDKKDAKIAELEKQVSELKQKNEATYEGEIGVPATGNSPDQGQSSILPPGITEGDIHSMFPEGTTFEETNSKECYKKAYDTFIAAGIKKCGELGYTQVEIQADKCQLDTSFINKLNTERKNAEAQCSPY